MNSRYALKTIIKVTASNIMTIIAGIIVGFVIPKVLSVDDYGYYKTFTLYINYIGIFSLGIIDGIVLEYGGLDYEKYDHRFFRSVFRWYLIIHLIWLLVLVCSCIWMGKGEHSFILLMLAVYMLFSNTVGYFQQISQITQRFNEYSIAKTLQSLMRILGGAIIAIMGRIMESYVNYRIYVILITFGMAVVSIGYIIAYRDIVFGESSALKSTIGPVRSFSLSGFPLMFANICATLILALDRQFVNVLFSNSEYAIYAFAYNLLSLVTVATSAVSTVLYPILKRTTRETLKKNYSFLISTMLVFVYGAILVYFPLVAIVRWFLPNYTDSLRIFRAIFPGLAISSTITVVMHNYYKTLGDNIKYFKKSIHILILSATANLIAYYVFRTTLAISYASIFTMVIWYLYIEQYFVDRYHYSRARNLGYLMAMMAAFYSVTCLSNWLVSCVIYLVMYLGITLLFQKDALFAAKGFLKGTE